MTRTDRNPHFGGTFLRIEVCATLRSAEAYVRALNRSSLAGRPNGFRCVSEAEAAGLAIVWPPASEVAHGD